MIKEERALVESVNELQAHIGLGNARRGFHEEGDGLRRMVAQGSSNFGPALRNYYITKLALVVTEIAEAIEELRNGREIDESYYSGGSRHESISLDARGNLRKPEGAPSEIADAVIRLLDLADEAGIPLIEVILHKLEFNETRERLHGKATV